METTAAACTPAEVDAFAAALRRLSVHDHCCLIHETREEQLAAVLPFVRHGLAAGDRCVYIADHTTVDAVLDALRAGGVDATAECVRGALQVITARASYLRDGGFDPDAMLTFLGEATASALADGFSALRVTGEMTWVLGDPPGAERLLEYESRLNEFLPDHDALALCQYDRLRFAPDLLLDIVRTHPTAVAGYTVCDNPYFVPPEGFLHPEGKEAELDRALQTLVRSGRAGRESAAASRAWSATFDAISDLVCLLDRDGTILRCNRPMAEMLGLEPGDVAGRKCYELMHGERDFFENCPYVEMLRTGRRESLDLLLGDRWFHVTADPLRDLDGAVTGAVHIVRDVTESRLANERVRTMNAELERRVAERTSELSTANRRLQEFIYAVSHDLRTPLRAIDGFSLAVLESEAEILSEAGKDDLRRVRAAAQRLGRVIDGVVSLASVGRGKLVLERVDLSRMAAQIVAELRAAQPGRSVEASIEHGLAATTDALLAEVVLANLLGNAWKFTSLRPDAHISVGAVGRDGRRAFYVRDDGVGFDPAYAHKLFVPFETLHGTGEFSGAGVGLATVARTLERLGGTCWAESSPGEGAAFNFLLGDAAEDG